jgi:uncharacterized membrane protein YdbT with pleckstrin-like domain
MAEPQQQGRAEATHVSTEETPDAKKDVAGAALEALPAADRDKVIGQLRRLPEDYKAEIVNSLTPTQPVTDWVWKVIVGTFALVFLIAALALCASALWFPNDNLQILLTVVTTIAGILAGFISGRASTGNTPSNTTSGQ